MRTIKNLAGVGAMAVLTVALAACGGTAATPSSDGAATSAAAPPSTVAPASTNGVTTTSQVFGPACGQLPQGDAPGSLDAMGPQPVATAASTNPLLSTLVTAVKAAGLVDTLNSASNVTVFAPYNGAFDAVQKQMGAPKFDALLQNQKALGSLLQYHVSSTRYDATSLVAAGKIAELDGGDLTIGGTPSAPTVTDGHGNTAKILCGNIPTANATVFVIDKVLMPKS